MKKILGMFYLEEKERTSDYSRGFLYVLEDGTKIEVMSTDPVADKKFCADKECGKSAKMGKDFCLFHLENLPV